MVNLSLIKIVLLCFIFIFISGNPVSQEFELNEISEIICETEESAESESKESYRGKKNYDLKVLIKYCTTVKNKFKNYFNSISSFSTGKSSQNFNSGHFFCFNSCILNYPGNLRYINFYHSINSIFVNISRLKKLRISKMRC